MMFEVTSRLSADTIEKIAVFFSSAGPAVLLDVDAVYSDLHIRSGVMHAARSIFRGTNRARDPAIEVLRWISGAHQVSEALTRAGPDAKTGVICVLQLPEGWPDRVDLEGLPELKPSFEEHEDDLGLRPIPVRCFEEAWGKEKALDKLGVVSSGGTSKELMALLEKVATIDL